MDMTSPAPSGPDARDPTASRAPTSSVVTSPAPDASRRSSRLYSYGIAVVFSLMLILLVVVGLMLFWPK